MSGDPEQEYFADGMVEDIITALSRTRRLFVIARNSTFTYKGRAVDVKQIGRELGVRYVLEGSVRKAASHRSFAFTSNLNSLTLLEFAASVHPGGRTSTEENLCDTLYSCQSRPSLLGSG
jgi:hypothetical protein